VCGISFDFDSSVLLLLPALCFEAFFSFPESLVFSEKKKRLISSHMRH